MEYLLLWVRGKFTDGAKNLIHRLSGFIYITGE